MRYAKVLVTDLSSKGKRIFHTGDEVNETSFHPGSFDKLLEGKFLEEIFPTVEKPVSVDLPKTDLEKGLEEKGTNTGDEVNETTGGKKNDEEESEESFSKSTKNNRKK